jgi:predicted small secreted protein
MKKSLHRFLFLTFIAGFIALVCSGCQTTKGFGKDVEDLGEEIQGD